MQLTKNFKKEEFDSKDGAEMPKDVLENIKLLAKYVQIIRNEAGVPLVINSGYRSPQHNAKVGGVKNSYHVQGKASDLNPKGITPKQLYDFYYEVLEPKKCNICNNKTKFLNFKNGYDKVCSRSCRKTLLSKEYIPDFNNIISTEELKIFY